MNAFLLMIPLFLIRFGVLGLVDKKALRRAAFFAPMEDKERIAYLFYQLSNWFLILYPFALKVRTAFPLLFIAIIVYAVGVTVLLMATVAFAKPNPNGINTEGIYRLSRNPMYMGYFIFFLGCALLTRSLPLLLALLVFQLSTHWIIRAEERWCLGQFGGAYRRYMDKVRRYI